MSAAPDGPDVGPHLEELAELHALGALESSERFKVEAHVAHCTRCARALARAAATVAALDDAFVPRLDPPERLGARIAASASLVVTRAPGGARATGPVRRVALAAAAALALGIGGGGLVERWAGERAALRDSAVLATLATSHFNHVTFVRRDPAAPVSKVLYARDGAWLYVIIDSATCDCRVVARSAHGSRDMGAPQPRGNTATLFAADAERPASLALVDAAGRVVAAATLVYPTGDTSAGEAHHGRASGDPRRR